MQYLKYSPSIEDLEKIESHYWEVWQGLPKVEFKPAKSKVGDTLRYYKDGNYIWVPTNALNAYKNNLETIYLAMMRKTSPEKIWAIWITPQSSGLEETIKKIL